MCLNNTFKKNILEAYVKEFALLPKQGSIEWIENRMETIGGSEMSIITGENPYSSMADLVAGKVGFSKFSGNVATRWGSLFENMSSLIFKIMFTDNEKVYEIGSIQHNVIKHHKYSPDGLSIVNIGNQDKIILLEFKAPYLTIPTDKIPNHYNAQIKSGMCTINIADHGLFINNMFRKCDLEKLNFDGTYDTNYHRESKKNIEIIDDIVKNGALAHGIIYFDMSEENISKFNELFNFTESEDIMYDSDDDFYMSIMGNQSIIDKIRRNIGIYKNKKSRIIDLGKEDRNSFDKFLDIFNSLGLIDVKYIKPQINENLINNFIIPPELQPILEEKKYIRNYNYNKIIDNLSNKSLANKKIPIAVLPWKLFKSSNILVDRDDSFLDNHAKKITETIDIIKIINGTDSMKEKINIFRKYFPKCDPIKKYNLIDIDFLADVLEIDD